jgi:hypothetical protein
MEFLLVEVLFSQNLKRHRRNGSVLVSILNSRVGNQRRKILL